VVPTKNAWRVAPCPPRACADKVVLHVFVFVVLHVMKASTSTASSAPAHNALPPPSAQVAARSSRIAPHSHIKGLGLNADGLAATDGAGFIGQTNAREVSLL
jgi:hypothetical protein